MQGGGERVCEWRQGGGERVKTGASGAGRTPCMYHYRTHNSLQISNLILVSPGRSPFLDLPLWCVMYVCMYLIPACTVPLCTYRVKHGARYPCLVLHMLSVFTLAFRLAISKGWLDRHRYGSINRSTPCQLSQARRRAASLARVCDFGVQDADDADGNLSAGPRTLCTRRPPLQPCPYGSTPLCRSAPRGVCIEIKELHGDHPTRSTFLVPSLSVSPQPSSQAVCHVDSVICIGSAVAYELKVETRAVLLEDDVAPYPTTNAQHEHTHGSSR
jgi:hypothetical protein